MSPFEKCLYCNNKLEEHDVSWFDKPNHRHTFDHHGFCRASDHIFRQVCHEGTEDVLDTIVLTVSMSPLVRVKFNLKNNSIAVAKGTIDEIIKDDSLVIENAIPWFDPDFSDLNALITYLKTFQIVNA